MARKDRSTSGDEPASRLSPVDRSRDLLPFRRADELKQCCLYWLPVRSFPAPDSQKNWQLEFFKRLVQRAKDKWALRVETFFQYKSVIDINDQFQRTAMEFQPLLGLSRRPNAGPLPLMPTNEQLHEDPEAVLRGEKKININDYLADYCYWFVTKAGEKQRESFLGRGGMTMMFLKADPNTVPPEIYFSPHDRETNKAFQMMDVDAVIQGGFSLADEFLPKSKELFGEDLKDEPQIEGIKFILPLLHTADFFSQPKEMHEKWFGLFDLYVNESPDDKGLLLASKTDLDEDLIEMLKEMREEDFVYPEG
ncbi:MAG TPA: hypothetical protein VML01_13910 [Bryobacterales bacterium]|nr:hypothetical protein [Bryobacterales bacterium]